MRRGIYVLMLCVFLGSCQRSDNPPPKEVLKRAARASQELSSARFVLVGNSRWSYHSIEGEVTFNTDGRLQNGGDQVQFLTSVQGNIRPEQGDRTSLTSVFEVVTLGAEEMYLKIHAIDSQSPHPWTTSGALKGVMGTWLQLSIPVHPPLSSLAPDPHVLEVQSRVVDVVHDRGKTRYAGRSVYHYDVQLNTGKLKEFLQEVSRAREESFDSAAFQALSAFFEANGELFIDAETFLIHRLVWHIGAPHLPFGTFSLDLTLDLRDHGVAPPILPPLDAIPFPLAPTLPAGVTGIDAERLFQEMPPALQEELLKVATDDAS